MEVWSNGSLTLGCVCERARAGGHFQAAGAWTNAQALTGQETLPRSWPPRRRQSTPEASKNAFRAPGDAAGTGKGPGAPKNAFSGFHRRHHFLRGIPGSSPLSCFHPHHVRRMFSLLPVLMRSSLPTPPGARAPQEPQRSTLKLGCELLLAATLFSHERGDSRPLCSSLSPPPHLACKEVLLLL